MPFVYAHIYTQWNSASTTTHWRHPIGRASGAAGWGGRVTLFYS